MKKSEQSNGGKYKNFWARQYDWTELVTSFSNIST